MYPNTLCEYAIMVKCIHAPIKSILYQIYVQFVSEIMYCTIDNPVHYKSVIISGILKRLDTFSRLSAILQRR